MAPRLSALPDASSPKSAQGSRSPASFGFSQAQAQANTLSQRAARRSCAKGAASTPMCSGV